MSFYYYLLGLAAWMVDRGGRSTTNMVPLSFVPLILLPVGLMMIPFTLLSMMDLGKPQQISLGELHRKEKSYSSRVVVRGRFVWPVLRYATITSMGEEQYVAYVPFVDKRSGAGVVVRMRAGEATSQPDGEITLTGEMQPELRNWLPRVPKKVAGVPLIQDSFLWEGDAGAGPGGPLNPLIPGSIAFAGFLVMAVYLPAFMLQSVVFRKEAPAEGLAPLSTPPSNVSVTGLFILNEKVNQRFVCVRATLERHADGGLGFYANIDASVQHTLYHFIPMGTDQRSGTWMIELPPRSIMRLEPGTQYFCLDSYPALRVQYRRAPHLGPLTLVLSFEDSEDRDAMAAYLSTV